MQLGSPPCALSTCTLQMMLRVTVTLLLGPSNSRKHHQHMHLPLHLVRPSSFTQVCGRCMCVMSQPGCLTSCVQCQPLWRCAWHCRHSSPAPGQSRPGDRLASPLRLAWPAQNVQMYCCEASHAWKAEFTCCEASPAWKAEFTSLSTMYWKHGIGRDPHLSVALQACREQHQFIRQHLLHSCSLRSCIWGCT